MNAAHPNPKDWFADPTLALAWAETWSQPHMQRGLEVLMQMGLPKSLVIAPVGDPIQNAALRHAVQSGYYDFARGIEALKQRNHVEPPPESPGAHWGEANLGNPPSELAASPAAPTQ